ncbi:hypothetical protein [uncultured Gimesia sp.]|uniref:hypothetical protein n=1 Tax=uncultured Gimesia sp. TaxID=1678688 RepID=UPI0026109CE4|nr:hypothetical protein [uncultured Gimesia sp.]
MGSSTSSSENEFIASTHAECARFFNVSTKTIQIWLGEGCPGKRGAYPLNEMVQWVKNNRWCKSSDPLLAGGDSDNLERYRGVKADLAELDLDERKGTLIDPDLVRDAYVQSLRFIRDAAEQIDRQYGNDAFLIIYEAWERAEKYIMKELADDGQ